MKDTPLLSVIIVSYNTCDLTLQALKSTWRDIEGTPLLRDVSEVIVIDNHSSDESVATISKAMRTTRVPSTLIKNSSNRGFAQANNQGLAKAQGDYILLLNSDTFVQRGALAKLVTSFIEDDQSGAEHRSRKLGIVAATLLNADGTLQAQGGDIPTLGSLFWQMSMLDDVPLLGQLVPSLQHTGRRANRRIRATTMQSALVEQGWVGGTALMLSAALIKEIGGLDEKIFMYAEDIEFCLRARHHHWRVAIHPSARITHFAHQSSSPKNAIRGEFAGILYLWSKHFPLWQAAWVRLLLQWGAFVRSLLHTLARNPEKANIYTELFNDLGAS